MERVPLPTFVEFVFTAGKPRIQVAKTFKDHRYDHLADFYKPLREAIIDTHAGGKPLSALDDFLRMLTDERKRRVFPGLVEAYRKWFHASPKRWIAPPRSMLPIGDLEIDIAPPLGFEIDGRPTFIYLHFSGATLAQKRVDVLLGFVSAALGPVMPTTQFGLLDVGRSKLHTLRHPSNPRLGLLARGEAASFATIYAAV